MNKDLEAFLKDPKGWVKRQNQLHRDKVRDLQNYRDRQRQILEDVYHERMREYAEEHEASMKRAAQWARERGLSLEDDDGS